MDLRELRQKPHLSASSIGTYIDCQLKYYFAYVKRLPMEFVADALEFGTAIHAVLADFYQVKMTLGKMSLKDVHESFRQHWHRIAFDRSDIQYADGKDFNTYEMLGVDLLTTWYHKLPDDDFRVISIEESFSFEIPKLPIPIIGVMDLVEEDSSGTIVITDFKTAGRSYSADEIDQNMQMTVYQLAAKANGAGDKEILLKLDCLIKTKQPKFEQYYTIRSVTDELRLIRKIQTVWESMQAGIYVPNDGSWKCQTCPYRQACDKWFLEGGE
jgi:putative RecB family exonuclease